MIHKTRQIDITYRSSKLWQWCEWYWQLAADL